MLAKDLKTGDKIYIVRNAVMYVYEVKEVIDFGYYSEVHLYPIIDSEVSRPFSAFFQRSNDKDVDYDNELNLTTTSLEKALNCLGKQLKLMSESHSD